jgi:hypothetical protein
MKSRGLTLSLPVGLIVVSLLVAAGGRTYAATPTPSPTPIVKPSPTSSAAWTARELDRIIIEGGWGGIVRVWVPGQYGLPVTIRAQDGAWSVSNFAGSKPEYGSGALEFAPVWPGRYVITPRGLGVSYTLDILPGHVAQVRFEPNRVSAPTPSPEPSPSLYLLPSPSLTPVPQASTLGAPPPLLPAPTLLEPPDGTAVSLKIRLDLAWTWEGTLGPDDYFQVEIWNDFNDFSAPVDVAWVRDSIYKNDSNTNPIYGPKYRWRITVIRGIPVREKDWSTAENRVWEPSDEYRPISQESETWTLIIDPACPPGDRSC